VSWLDERVLEDVPKTNCGTTLQYSARVHPLLI